MNFAVRIFRQLSDRKYRIYSNIADRFTASRFGKRCPSARLEKISKGSRRTIKYRLVSGQDIRFVRVFPLRTIKTVRKIYRAGCELSRAGCAVIPPVSFDRDLLFAYYAEPWTEGVTLKEHLPSLPEEQKYAMGLAAGRVLQKFHGSTLRFPREDLTVRLQRIIRKFKRSSHDLFGLKKALLPELEAAFEAVRKRPRKLIHGDLHLNNMMISAEGQITVTDLEELCIGDPLYDLASLMERNEVYAAFNKGLAESMDPEMTEEDWRAVGFYYMIRKISEYLQNKYALPSYLASREGWEKRCRLFSDADAIRDAMFSNADVIKEEMFSDADAIKETLFSGS